ncbi:hypothetical protein BBP40_000401, partial [Aspergillus hancockii]
PFNRDGYAVLQPDEVIDLARHEAGKKYVYHGDGPHPSSSPNAYQDYRVKVRRTGGSLGKMRWTLLNAIFFTRGLIFWLSPLSKYEALRRLSDQDLWKASSA